MQNRLDTLIVLRTILIISLFLMLPFISVFGISCQPGAPPSSEPPKEPTPGASSTTEVTIEGFAFRPAEITITEGTTITWYNKDSTAHTVTTQDKTFDSGSLLTGAKFSYTFKQKGTFEYYCRFHPSMIGKVTVK